MNNDRETILKFISGTLEEMTSDWDSDYEKPIGRDTRLIADLAFESIDVVQLIVAIEEEFQRRDLNFEQLLMSDGRYVDEFRVGDIVDFLYARLNDANQPNEAPVEKGQGE
jgi:acyl carrier protein